MKKGSQWFFCFFFHIKQKNLSQVFTHVTSIQCLKFLFPVYDKSTVLLFQQWWPMCHYPHRKESCAPNACKMACHTLLLFQQNLTVSSSFIPGGSKGCSETYTEALSTWNISPILTSYYSTFTKWILCKMLYGCCCWYYLNRTTWMRHCSICGR
jgi:hypothetical protein